MTVVAKTAGALEIQPGTSLADRFVIRAQLGAGAFGTVYSATDTASGSLVAIKRLTRATGTNIYRFKKEFRALADRRHGNLVRFHELFSEQDDWFFSMELVEGEHFDSYVLGPRLRPQQPATEPDGPLPDAARSSWPPASPNLEKLRPALSQLVAAIRDLHAAGVVHRDLKPANVLVTPEGRLVVLDFGLATESDPDAQKSVLGVVMGTPTYMSPEQALGRATTEAADWYSLGVMLFEVLYGRPPFSGTVHDVLTAKLSPSTWHWPDPVAEARDLCELSRALMHPEPEQRPTGDEIARLLDAKPFAAPPTRPSLPASFVGRADELRTLTNALDAVAASGTVVLRISGQSGVGKSALIRHFLQSLGGEVVTLQGRCYERESVPYKTLDGVVDALTRYLSLLKLEEASLLVPREAQALCRLFPVFARLRLLADQPERKRSPSPHDERRRGFAALREVLARIADRRPLVVTIDDLQWGDLDSIAPLCELLAAPDPPRLLLLLAYRSEDESRSPVLRALGEPPFVTSVADIRTLHVGPLREADAVALAESLLPAGEHERAATLAKEAGGIPFFVPELVRAQRKTRGAPVVSLEEAMALRVSQLSLGARRLLEVIAVAGRPLPRSVVCTAARLSGAERDAASFELAQEQFVRSASAEDSLIETFHDRIRESVVALLPSDQLRAHHEALALALVESGAFDAEALAEHYRLAGKLSDARPVAVLAAERATDALAFERAIALYDAARDGAPSEEQRLLTSKLADVLSYAGRGREAGAAYLAAVEGAAPKEARELRRRAAEQLIRGGAIEEGIALSRELLAEAGIPYRDKRSANLASLVAQRALLAARGLSFKERALTPDDDDAVNRVDVAYTVGASLSPIDIIRGAELHTRGMRYALALGDPYRVARGLALMANSLGAQNGESRVKAEKVVARASEIARRIDHPHAIGNTHGALAVIHWCGAQWRRALQDAQDIKAVFRERCPENMWHLGLLDVFITIRSLFLLGELESFVAETERVTRSAEERNDELVLATVHSVGMTKLHLMQNRLDDARLSSEHSIGRWSGGDWHLAHQESLRAQLWCDLYEGDGRRGLERVAASANAVKASLLMHAELERVQSHSLTAAAAVMAGDEEEAERWLRTLARERHVWAQASVQALRGGLLALQGSQKALATYEDAAKQFDALEMPLFALAARRRRGELLAGDEGASSVAAADEVFRARGVGEPARWARMLVP